MRGVDMDASSRVVRDPDAIERFFSPGFGAASFKEQGSELSPVMVLKAKRQRERRKGGPRNAHSPTTGGLGRLMPKRPQEERSVLPDQEVAMYLDRRGVQAGRAQRDDATEPIPSARLRLGSQIV